MRLLPILLIGLAVYFLLKPSQRALLRRWLAPVVTVFLALLYVPLPIDLIPDVGPIGFLDDLIVVLGAFWWARQQMGKPRPQSRAKHTPGGKSAEAGAPARWDPHAVLGVQRNASSDEITRAYREQMKRYHPDRVADLGEALQKVAHEKTVEIRRAYDELRTL